MIRIVRTILYQGLDLWVVFCIFNCILLFANTYLQKLYGPSWSHWYDSWIYNYLCNQCLL